MIIVQIAGRLGRDPESRVTATGLKVTTLTVATNVRKGGKEDTAWWRVTVWGDRYDKMISFLKKGSAVIVIGEMNKPDIWTDKEGRPQVSLEMTADILRFSPFGGTDSNKEQNNNQTHHSNNGSGNDHGFNDAGGNNFNYSGAGNGSGSQYGTSQGSSMGRFNQSIPHNEENLPF